MRDTQRQRHRPREKQAPCEEPDTGLHPRTSGSQPEPKADAQPLSHPGIPGKGASSWRINFKMAPTQHMTYKRVLLLPGRWRLRAKQLSECGEQHMG